MDIRYLNYILALAETGNMTRAAEKLYISQPTLSQFLTKQEHELGMPLFQRSGGVYTLTPAGALYAEYAEKVLSLTEDLDQNLQKLSNTSRIHVATSSSRSLQLFTSILVDFRKYFPNVELIMSDGSLYAMHSLINRGEIDIAFITAHSLEPYKGQIIELIKEEIVLAVPSSNPFCRSVSGQSSLNSSQFQELFTTTPFIRQHKGSCIRYLIDDFFSKQNFVPTIACNTNNAQSICDMVAGNVGVGFVPIGYKVPSPQITYFSLEPKMYRIHSILYSKELIMEEPHKYLLELAKEYAKIHWKHLPGWM